MKKHFIFLGVPGVIYYSWLLSLIFVAVVFGYEKDNSLSLPCLTLSIIFVVWLIYTWVFSYFKDKEGQYSFKLPYHSLSKIGKPQLRTSWKIFNFYEIKDNYHNYLVMCIKSNKKKENI
ncbi:hypothetical protein [Lactobacillus sp.]|uniref:hypothetical protein n=1 Tax=Lactobacillus sp. TaxID=1591 RepID=UPI00199542DD|nr:hypothetical protein [Lactobacillus sp.]MBD5429657.1 hypothetical protein [Lactobacillus sp.]